MPQIRVISRTAGDKQGYHRNFSSNEHRFARGREYIRAVRAAKLEQLHAKPFVTAFDGHVETISKLVKVRNKLPTIISGDWDGELRCWDISQQLLNWRVQAHRGRIMGCTTTNTSSSSDDFSSASSNNLVITSGQDKTIKIWKLAVPATARKVWERDDAQSSISGLSGIDSHAAKKSNYALGDQTPVSTIHHHEPLHCLDSCWEAGSSLYASGSSKVSLWDVNRTHPLHSFTSGTDHVVCCSFNPGQYNLLAAGLQDRKIAFYDTRAKQPMPYISLNNWVNEIKFNPIDPRIFVVASNDWCLYTFDIRKPRRALRTHRGHIDAVKSVDWSPTGDEFVSGAMDGHIRLWKSTHNSKDAARMGYSRELYKGRRMYNLEQVRWTSDNRYIISGSADGAIRLWKAQRAAPLHKLNARQRAHLNYCQRLKEKYAHMSEVGTIWKFRKAKLPHRIPRNGVFYHKEKMERHKLNSMKKKLQSRGKREWIEKGYNKKSDNWASKVVQNSGIVHENIE